MFIKTTASTCLSYLENVNDDQDSQLSAWKKVFNDFSGGAVIPIQVSEL